MYHYLDDKKFVSKMRSLCGDIMQDLCHILKEDYDEPLTEILINNLAKQLQVEDIEGIKEKGYLYQDYEMFISNNFILDNEKIVFIYNKYEIAPYAVGDIMIDVTYEELKDLLK